MTTRREDVSGVEKAFSWGVMIRLLMRSKADRGPPVLQATCAMLALGVQPHAGLMASRTCDATSEIRPASMASIRGGKMM